MKIAEFKKIIENLSALNFMQINGSFVPRHFHITEIGLNTKHFIDCGGTVRTEKTISLQLWTADDYAHRLAPQKLLNIIKLSEPLFNNENLEVEVEYQTETISRYGLHFSGYHFELTKLETDCLAKDKCGIPVTKEKIKLADLQKSKSSCTPGSGCC